MGNLSEKTTENFLEMSNWTFYIGKCPFNLDIPLERHGKAMEIS